MSFKLAGAEKVQKATYGAAVSEQQTLARELGHARAINDGLRSQLAEKLRENDLLRQENERLRRRLEER